MDQRDFYLRLAATVGTFLAVIVALFGDRIRASLFRPKLSLGLLTPLGEATPAFVPLNTGTVAGNARYHHVQLSNSSSSQWPKATSAQVCLVRVEEFGPDGNPQVRWTGEVPLRWQWHEIQEARRDVGPPIIADLCCVMTERGFSLQTLITPTALGPFIIRPLGQPFDMIVTLRARATETTSPLLAIRISWDGQWADGDAEMAKHLVVATLRPAVHPYDLHY